MRSTIEREANHENHEEKETLEERLAYATQSHERFYADASVKDMENLDKAQYEKKHGGTENYEIRNVQLPLGGRDLEVVRMEAAKAISEALVEMGESTDDQMVLQKYDGLIDETVQFIFDENVGILVPWEGKSESNPNDSKLFFDVAKLRGAIISMKSFLRHKLSFPKTEEYDRQEFFSPSELFDSVNAFLTRLRTDRDLKETREREKSRKQEEIDRFVFPLDEIYHHLMEYTEELSYDKLKRTLETNEENAAMKEAVYRARNSEISEISDEDKDLILHGAALLKTFKQNEELIEKLQESAWKSEQNFLEERGLNKEQVRHLKELYFQKDKAGISYERIRHFLLNFVETQDAKTIEEIDSLINEYLQRKEREEDESKEVMDIAQVRWALSDLPDSVTERQKHDIEAIAALYGVDSQEFQSIYEALMNIKDEADLEKFESEIGAKIEALVPQIEAWQKEAKRLEKNGLDQYDMEALQQLYLSFPEESYQEYKKKYIENRDSIYGKNWNDEESQLREAGAYDYLVNQFQRLYSLNRMDYFLMKEAFMNQQENPAPFVDLMEKAKEEALLSATWELSALDIPDEELENIASFIIKEGKKIEDIAKIIQKHGVDSDEYRELFDGINHKAS